MALGEVHLFVHAGISAAAAVWVASCDGAPWPAPGPLPPGMLLLNRGVYAGSSIMFDSGGVPEDAFPLPMGPGAPEQSEDDVAV